MHWVCALIATSQYKKFWPLIKGDLATIKGNIIIVLANYT